MKIKILGSGGGEGYPAMFCSCKHCESARKTGGKSIRTLSQTLINDDLLIDFPADTNMHCLQHGINLGKIQNLIITHAHEDHYFPIGLNFRGDCYAHNFKYEKLHIYGPENLENKFEEAVATFGINSTVRENLVFTALQAFQVKTIGNYTVTTNRAQHAPHLSPLNYVIEKENKVLLYLLDSGYPTAQTLQFWEGKGKTFNAVIMDATNGVLPPDPGNYHMGFDDNKMLKEDLIKRNLANEKTRFIITHITHNQAETHDKIEKIFEGTNIEVAYDGFEIEI